MPFSQSRHLHSATTTSDGSVITIAATSLTSSQCLLDLCIRGRGRYRLVAWVRGLGSQSDSVIYVHRYSFLSALRLKARRRQDNLVVSPRAATGSRATACKLVYASGGYIFCCLVQPRLRLEIFRAWLQLPADSSCVQHCPSPTPCGRRISDQWTD